MDCFRVKVASERGKLSRFSWKNSTLTRAKSWFLGEFSQSCPARIQLQLETFPFDLRVSHHATTHMQVLQLAVVLDRVLVLAFDFKFSLSFPPQVAIKHLVESSLLIVTRHRHILQGHNQLLFLGSIAKRVQFHHRERVCFSERQEAAKQY